MNVLLSIKLKYFRSIASGQKGYEFRRRIFRQPVSTVYLYCNSDIKGIAGGFTAGEILDGSPAEIWKRCSKAAGMDRDSFFDYFKNSEVAYAIRITNFFEFEKPLDLSLLSESLSPPRSFRYLPAFALVALAPRNEKAVQG